MVHILYTVGYIVRAVGKTLEGINLGKMKQITDFQMLEVV